MDLSPSSLDPAILRSNEKIEDLAKIAQESSQILIKENLAITQKCNELLRPLLKSPELDPDLKEKTVKMIHALDMFYENENKLINIIPKATEAISKNTSNGNLKQLEQSILKIRKFFDAVLNVRLFTIHAYKKDGLDIDNQSYEYSKKIRAEYVLKLVVQAQDVLDSLNQIASKDNPTLSQLVNNLKNSLSLMKEGLAGLLDGLNEKEKLELDKFITHLLHKESTLAKKKQIAWSVLIGAIISAFMSLVVIHTIPLILLSVSTTFLVYLTIGPLGYSIPLSQDNTLQVHNLLKHDLLAIQRDSNDVIKKIESWAKSNALELHPPQQNP